MSITYIEKGIGLHNTIIAAGHWLAQINGVWTSDNDAAVQLIINNYNYLPDYQAIGIASIKATGLAKINALFPAITSIDQIQFFAEFWLSIASAARSPTANFTAVINIYTAAKNGIAAVQAASTTTGVDAAVAAVAWP